MNSLSRSTGESLPCEMRRREFIRLASAGVVGALFARTSYSKGLEDSRRVELVPANKRLDPTWLDSLSARGEPSPLRGEELRFVGFPVSGLTTGQIYLGGDGKLWHWDIFNQFVYTDSFHYEHPPLPSSPLVQGFFLQIGDKVYPTDRTGFSEVSFLGQYPIGTVNYHDREIPVAVTLEAYSPFIPLLLADSSLPLTVMEFTLRNTSGKRKVISLWGELENAVCRFSPATSVRRRNRITREEGFVFLDCLGEAVPDGAAQIMTIEGWGQPATLQWTGNGKFTSAPFTIEAPYLNFDLGGVGRAFAVEVKLLLEGRLVRLAKCPANEKRRADGFDVAELMGRVVRLEICHGENDHPPSFGIGVISASDRPWRTANVTELPDFGTMGLALVGEAGEIREEAKSGVESERPIGRLGRTLSLSPNETAKVTFIVAWSFPNLWLTRQGRVGRHYAVRFPTAYSAAHYVAAQLPRLRTETFLWRDTWYDSTLPYWFLDRTFVNTSTLATSTSLRFRDGRFWAWEGVGNCAGTCTHVWGYGQALGRLFPELERMLRHRVDFDSAMSADGRIGFRGNRPTRIEPGNWAVDGQSMVILRTLREHQMSSDDLFLRRVWPKVKNALKALMAMDPAASGFLQGPQHNTLDAEWFGKIAWLSALYQAALRAGEVMAEQMGDKEFAEHCGRRFRRGQSDLHTSLFDGEYFVNQVDSAHLESINSGTGCHIDQVLGQSWAFQVGLGRTILPEDARKALGSLWQYNFTSEIGVYRSVYKPGRWLAMPGERGLLMCTFPRSDWSFEKAAGGHANSDFAGYFNECMNGFEYQVASHMIWEGMVLEGLAVTRAVHDRYAASRRNPWNEIEWGDHYARSMASYGVMIAACGFTYHGPKGRLGFAPRLTSNAFRAPFTTAEGWGTFAQTVSPNVFKASVSIRWGKLKLSELSLQTAVHGGRVVAKVDERTLAVSFLATEDRSVLTLARPVELVPGQTLQVEIASA